MTPPPQEVAREAAAPLMPDGPARAASRLLRWLDGTPSRPTRRRRNGDHGRRSSTEDASDAGAATLELDALDPTLDTALDPSLDQALDRVLSSAVSSAASSWYERGRGRPALSPAAYERMKRVLDVALCLAALPFALVLLAVLALAIRLDSPGPALFVQHRTGRGGRRFRMYKLRTMVQNADELKEKWAHLNELTWPDFKITDDPRMTRMGRFLRRTSLDELPQILNVLRGDMSLVGPRPTSFGADTYTLWHTARLEVQPGVTGLWQISGRSELDFDERLRLDIAYIRNRSLRLDLSILLRTFGAVTSGRGAT